MMISRLAVEPSMTVEEYQQREIPLREELVDRQFELSRTADRAVIVILSGLDTVGVREANHRLADWLEPHLFETIAFGPPGEDARARPPRWRHMINLPPRGRVAFMLGSWYTDPVAARIDRRLGRHEFEYALEDIKRFERMLIAEHVCLVKIWLAMSPDEWHRRVGRLRRERDRRAASGEWGELDAAALDRLALMPEELSRVTGTADAPWIIVPSADRRYRDIAIGTALNRALAAPKAASPVAATAPLHAPSPVIRAPTIDISGDEPEIPRAAYEEELTDLQARLAHLSTTRRFQKIAVVAAFEGLDAAGKGGAIRRATHPLDPRLYRVRPIAQPTDQERARPYLWRFWRQLPRRGTFAFFDRSWYGRVLVERVEGLIDAAAVERAHAEINDFERTLIEADFIPIKFWMAISKAEQLKRFDERDASPIKRFKLTPADWRGRENWDAYQKAAAEMIDRTDTDQAPWHIVPANHKTRARLQVLRTLIEAIESAV